MDDGADCPESALAGEPESLGAISPALEIPVGRGGARFSPRRLAQGDDPR